MYTLTTHVVDGYRLTDAASSTAYSASPIATGLDCAIVPASTEIIATYPGENAYALYEIFFDEYLALKTGDKLTDTAGAREWIIRGVPQEFENDYAGYAVHAVGERVA